MKIDVKKEKENPLLHRREIWLILSEFEGTPNKEAVVKEVAKKINSKEELISIEEIRQEYGKNEAMCHVDVYETIEHKKQYKPEKVAKGGKKEETKEEPKKEVPKEEVKEEKEKPAEKPAVEEDKEPEKTETKEETKEAE